MPGILGTPGTPQGRWDRDAGDARTGRQGPTYCTCRTAQKLQFTEASSIQHLAAPPHPAEVRKRACLATDAKQFMQARAAGLVPLPAGRDLHCAMRSASTLAYKKQRGMEDVDRDEAGDFVKCRTSKMSRWLKVGLRPARAPA